MTNTQQPFFKLGPCPVDGCITSYSTPSFDGNMVNFYCTQDGTFLGSAAVGTAVLLPDTLVGLQNIPTQDELPPPAVVTVDEATIPQTPVSYDVYVEQVLSTPQ
jgi:hypothetical protein